MIGTFDCFQDSILVSRAKRNYIFKRNYIVLVAVNNQHRLIADTFGNTVFLHFLIKAEREIDLSLETTDNYSTFFIVFRLNM